MTSNIPPEQREDSLIHEISSALAVAKGRAQLLRRLAPNLDEPDRSRLLTGLLTIDHAVMRAHAGLTTFMARDHKDDPSPQ